MGHCDEAQTLLKSRPQICAIGADDGQTLSDLPFCPMLASIDDYCRDFGGRKAMAGNGIGAGNQDPKTNEVAAAIIAWSFLVLMVLLLIWYNYLAMTEQFGVFPDDARPELYRSWRWFNWILIDSEFVGKLLAALFAVVGYGAQFYATMHRKLRDVLLICGLCIVGILAALTLMAEVDNGENLNLLRSFTSETNESYKTQARLVLGGAAAWYGAFLATQLGISWKKPAGAIANWLRRRSTPPPAA